MKKKRAKKPRSVNTSYTGTTGPSGYIFWAPSSSKSFVQVTLEYIKGWFR